MQPGGLRKLHLDLTGSPADTEATLRAVADALHSGTVVELTFKTGIADLEGLFVGGSQFASLTTLNLGGSKELKFIPEGSPMCTPVLWLILVFCVNHHCT